MLLYIWFPQEFYLRQLDLKFLKVRRVLINTTIHRIHALFAAVISKGAFATTRDSKGNIDLSNSAIQEERSGLPFIVINSDSI